MASPNRPNPDQPRLDVNDIGEERIVESVSRGGWRWWWIWPVIIALAFWWAGWGWGSTGGWWWGRAHSQNTAIPAPPGARTTETLANAGAQQPVTSAGADAGGAKIANQTSGPGVEILAAQDKQPFIGKSFAAAEVPVQQKVSDHAMWVGGSQPMLAVITRNPIPKDVDQAKVVDAWGTVQKAPPAAQAERDWSLSKQDAARVEHEGAYIQLRELKVPQHD
jgi:CTP:molybdopterin cytidylyltransferase MocA